MSDSQIYARQLLVKRHGYPLWVPEPYGNSTIYRTKGVRIGDVGYVTQEGAFETLFNIRAAPDDPVNRRGVPDGFQQIHVGVDDIVHLHDFHHPNGAVTSTSAKKRMLGASISTTQTSITAGASAGAAFEYVWSSTEGAILHLPQGGSRLTGTKRVFREQAILHAKSWYRFACLHADVPSGSLYIITGCDKTSSWMVGAFSNCESGTQAALQLSAAGLIEGQVSYNYSWSTSSPAIQRVGPSVDQTIASDVDPDALERDDSVFAVDAPLHSNQCIFIRGYRIALRRSVMAQILGGQSQVHISAIEELRPKDIQRNTHSFALSAEKSLELEEPKDSRISGRFRSASPEIGRDLYDISVGDTLLEWIPEYIEPYHPSTVINDLLLSHHPDAEIALTHDEDWMALIGDSDYTWPTNEEFLHRVRERYGNDLTDHPPPTSVFPGMSESKGDEYGFSEQQESMSKSLRQRAFRIKEDLQPNPSETLAKHTRRGEGAYAYHPYSPNKSWSGKYSKSVDGGSDGPPPSYTVNQVHGGSGDSQHQSHELKEYICRFCSKRFNRLYSLEIHINVHIGTPKYSCPEAGCGRSFNVKSNFRRHMRNHNRLSSPSLAGSLSGSDTSDRVSLPSRCSSQEL